MVGHVSAGLGSAIAFDLESRAPSPLFVHRVFYDSSLDFVALIIVGFHTNVTAAVNHSLVLLSLIHI